MLHTHIIVCINLKLRQYLTNILLYYYDRDSTIRKTISILINCFISNYGIEKWPELFNILCDNLDKKDRIENLAPKKKKKNTMDNLLIFTEDDDEILKEYTEISKDSLEEKEYEKLVKKYPALENETLYKINKISSDEKNNLNNLMVKPLMIVSYLNQEEMANQMKSQMISQIPENVPEQQKQAMQNMELIGIIKTMPEEQRNAMLSNVEEQLNKMQDSILQQAAIQAVKAEYKEMGVNTDSLQNTYIILAGLRMLGIAFVIMTASILIMLLSARVGAKLAKTLREKVFKKVLKFSNKEFTEYSTASLITRSTNDIQQIQGLIGMLFRTVIYAPIIGVGGFIRVLNQWHGL